MMMMMKTSTNGSSQCQEISRMWHIGNCTTWARRKEEIAFCHRVMLSVGDDNNNNRQTVHGETPQLDWDTPGQWVSSAALSILVHSLYLPEKPASISCCWCCYLLYPLSSPQYWVHREYMYLCRTSNFLSCHHHMLRLDWISPLSVQ